MISKKNETVEAMYGKLMDIISMHSKTKNGFRVKINASDNVVNGISRRLHNDGIFFDQKSGVILWNEEEIKKYNTLVGSVCSIRCSKNARGKCIGCLEYDSVARASSFAKEEITL